MYDNYQQPTDEIVETQTEDSAPAWVVSFGDMMSLLLCFFILLFGMSTLEKAKFKALLDSLHSALGVQNVSEPNPNENLEMSITKSKIEENDVEKLKRLVNNEMDNIKNDVEEFIVENKLKDNVSVKIDGRGAVITISDVILFRPGQAQITYQGYPIMEKLYAMLDKFQYQVRIEGHTDNKPINTERYPSNWELSTARASELVRYFIRKGISPIRLSAEGFAEYRPIADNSTFYGRAKNRRVEIVYIREDMEKQIMNNEAQKS